MWSETKVLRNGEYQMRDVLASGSTMPVTN
jgi:hypothetical protein